MELYVKGQQLDIYGGQDIQLNWENIRFTEGYLMDEWSTDVEMPNNEYNITLLEAYGLLDRGPIFNRQVPCQLVINDISYDAYLHVTEFDKDTIRAAVFLVTIPNTLYDKKLREYYPADDTSSIFRWDRMTEHTIYNAASDIAIYEYRYNDDYFSDINVQLNPSVRAEKIMQLIQNEENITLPTLDNDLFLTATKKVVCPQNKIQCFCARVKDNNAFNGDPLPLIGGQHITNDFKCEWSYKDFKWNQNWSDWDLLETYLDQTGNANKDTITFNRNCSCRIWVYGNTNRATWNVHIYKNNTDLTSGYVGGTNLYRIPNGQNDQPPIWSVNDCLSAYLSYTTFEEGDELTFRLGISSGAVLNTTANLAIMIEYIDYSITDDDFDTELNYYPMQFGLGYSWLNALGTVSTDGIRTINGTGFGVNGFLDHSFCYYGLWANMGNCSVKEFISNMCWVHGQKLDLDKYDLIFKSAKESQILSNATLNKITTYSDKFAKKNIIKYKDDNFPVIWNVDNDFLEDEKTVFESIFNTSIHRYGIATVNQYEFETKLTEPNSSGESWVEDVKVKLNEFDFLLFKMADNGHSCWLERAPYLSDFGMSDIVSTVTANITTTDDVREKDYVYMDGHKYLVVNGNVDMSTGLSELEAIEIPTKYRGECAPPRISVSFAPYVDSCVMQYSLFDNTGSGEYTVKVLHGSTVVGVYSLSIGMTQFLTILNLKAGTKYSVSIAGSNSCGELLETYTFTTMSGYPPTVTINQIFNVNAESAVIDFTINEN